LHPDRGARTPAPAAVQALEHQGKSLNCKDGEESLPLRR
jgi:hypothetical protein